MITFYCNIYARSLSRVSSRKVRRKRGSLRWLCSRHFLQECFVACKLSSFDNPRSRPRNGGESRKRSGGGGDDTRTESFSAAVAALSFVEHTANKSNTPIASGANTWIFFSSLSLLCLARVEDKYMCAGSMRMIQRKTHTNRIAFTLAHAASVCMYKRVHPSCVCAHVKVREALRSSRSRLQHVHFECNRLHLNDVNVNFNRIDR